MYGRAIRMRKVSSVTSSRRVGKTTTGKNFCLRCSTWLTEEWLKFRCSFAGRLWFWPITWQYRNVFTPRSTQLSADKDYRTWTTVHSQWMNAFLMLCLILIGKCVDWYLTVLKSVILTWLIGKDAEFCIVYCAVNFCLNVKENFIKY